MPVRSDRRAEAGSVETLRQLLCGEPDAWADAGEYAAHTTAWCESAERHGIHGLLAERAALLAPATPLDRELRRRLRDAAAVDVVIEHLLRELSAAFGTAGVAALLIKGADLAYGHYSRPHLRPRIDTDLLVTVDARDRCRDVLRSLGYVDVPQVDGDLVMYQQPFVKRQGAVAHTVDLHWRIANPQRFGSVLAFDDLYPESVERPQLGQSARGLSTTHAMVVSCVHRVAHHYDAPRLIWTYDLQVLATHMTTSDWNSLVGLAIDRRVAAVVSRGLTLAAEDLGSPVPPDVLAALARAAEREPEARAYFGPTQRHAARVLSDFALQPSWSARMRLARQHLFPPAPYMRNVYAPGSAVPLPLLYMRRAWSGARRWMARA